MKCLSAKNVDKSVRILLVLFFINSQSFNEASGLVTIMRPSTEYISSGERTTIIPGVDNFNLPKGLGSIKDSFKGSSDKFIVHIQDAHCNKAAQEGIMNILGYLDREYDIGMVNVEGGEGLYDLEFYTSIGTKEARGKAVDFFVSNGEMNGAEAYAIKYPGKIKLWGIEDAALYMRNLKVYRDSLVYKDKVEAQGKMLTHIVQTLKTKLFAGKLRKFDESYYMYKENEIDFKKFLGIIEKQAEETGIDTGKYVNMLAIQNTMKAEEEIDFKKANKQRDNVIDSLKREFSGKEVDELMLMGLKYKSGYISEGEFYKYLIGKAEFTGMPKEDYKGLSDYCRYIGLYESVDVLKMNYEIEEAVFEIKKVLFDNPEQERLDLICKDIYLLNNLFAYSLTKTDFGIYLNRKDEIDLDEIASFLKSLGERYNIVIKQDNLVEGMDNKREEVLNFFKLSFERDECFLENMVVDKREDGSEVAVMMTGGFHAENLWELFREKGISYVSIMPNFKAQEGYENRYFDMLSGRSGISALVEAGLRSDTSMLQIAARIALMHPGPWTAREKALFDIGFLAVTKVCEMGIVPDLQNTSIEPRMDGIHVRTNGEVIVISDAETLERLGELIAVMRGEGARDNPDAAVIEETDAVGIMLREMERYLDDVIARNPVGGNIGKAVGIEEADAWIERTKVGADDEDGIYYKRLHDLLTEFNQNQSYRTTLLGFLGFKESSDRGYWRNGAFKPLQNEQENMDFVDGFPDADVVLFQEMVRGSERYLIARNNGNNLCLGINMVKKFIDELDKTTDEDERKFIKELLYEFVLHEYLESINENHDLLKVATGYIFRGQVTGGGPKAGFGESKEMALKIARKFDVVDENADTVPDGFMTNPLRTIIRKHIEDNKPTAETGWKYVVGLAGYDDDNPEQYKTQPAISYEDWDRDVRPYGYKSYESLMRESSNEQTEEDVGFVAGNEQTEEDVRFAAGNEVYDEYTRLRNRVMTPGQRLQGYEAYLLGRLSEIIFNKTKEFLEKVRNQTPVTIEMYYGHDKDHGINGYPQSGTISNRSALLDELAASGQSRSEAKQMVNSMLGGDFEEFENLRGKASLREVSRRNKGANKGMDDLFSSKTAVRISILGNRVSSEIDAIRTQLVKTNPLTRRDFVTLSNLPENYMLSITLKREADSKNINYMGQFGVVDSENEKLDEFVKRCRRNNTDLTPFEVLYLEELAARLNVKLEKHLRKYDAMENHIADEYKNNQGIALAGTSGFPTDALYHLAWKQGIRPLGYNPEAEKLVELTFRIKAENKLGADSILARFNQLKNQVSFTDGQLSLSECLEITELSTELVNKINIFLEKTGYYTTRAQWIKGGYPSRFKFDILQRAENAKIDINLWAGGEIVGDYVYLLDKVQKEGGYLNSDELRRLAGVSNTLDYIVKTAEKAMLTERVGGISEDDWASGVRPENTIDVTSDLLPVVKGMDAEDKLPRYGLEPFEDDIKKLTKEEKDMIDIGESEKFGTGIVDRYLALLNKVDDQVGGYLTKEESALLSALAMVIGHERLEKCKIKDILAKKTAKKNDFQMLFDGELKVEQRAGHINFNDKIHRWTEPIPAVVKKGIFRDIVVKPAVPSVQLYKEFQYMGLEGTRGAKEQRWAAQKEVLSKLFGYRRLTEVSASLNHYGLWNESKMKTFGSIWYSYRRLAALGDLFKGKVVYEDAEYVFGNIELLVDATYVLMEEGSRIIEMYRKTEKDCLDNEFSLESWEEGIRPYGFIEFEDLRKEAGGPVLKNDEHCRVIMDNLKKDGKIELEDAVLLAWRSREVARELKDLIAMNKLGQTPRQGQFKMIEIVSIDKTLTRIQEVMQSAKDAGFEMRDYVEAKDYNKLYCIMRVLEKEEYDPSHKELNGISTLITKFEKVVENVIGMLSDEEGIVAIKPDKSVAGMDGKIGEQRPRKDYYNYKVELFIASLPDDSFKVAIIGKNLVRNYRTLLDKAAGEQGLSRLEVIRLCRLNVMIAEKAQVIFDQEGSIGYIKDLLTRMLMKSGGENSEMMREMYERRSEYGVVSLADMQKKMRAAGFTLVSDARQFLDNDLWDKYYNDLYRKMYLGQETGMLGDFLTIKNTGENEFADIAILSRFINTQMGEWFNNPWISKKISDGRMNLTSVEWFNGERPHGYVEEIKQLINHARELGLNIPQEELAFMESKWLRLEKDSGAINIKQAFQMAQVSQSLAEILRNRIVQYELYGISDEDSPRTVDESTEKGSNNKSPAAPGVTDEEMAKYKQMVADGETELYKGNMHNDRADEILKGLRAVKNAEGLSGELNKKLSDRVLGELDKGIELDDIVVCFGDVGNNDYGAVSWIEEKGENRGKLIILINQERQASFDGKQLMGDLIAHEILESRGFTHREVREIEIYQNRANINEAIISLDNKVAPLTPLVVNELDHMNFSQLARIMPRHKLDPHETVFEEAYKRMLDKFLNNGNKLPEDADTLSIAQLVNLLLAIGGEETDMRFQLTNKLIAKYGSELADCMSPDHENVNIIPVMADQLMFNQSAFDNVTNAIKRTFQKKKNINASCVLYPVDEKGNVTDETVDDTLRKLMKHKDFVQDGESFAVVFAQTEETKNKLNGILMTHFPEQLAATVMADMINKESAVPVTRLVLVGSSLAERHRRLKKNPDDKTAEEIERTLINLLSTFCENADELQGESPRNIIQKILNGHIRLVIRKIDISKEMRQAFAADRAVLRSL